MSNSVEDGIIVELDGDEIVVWKPGTVFLIAFKKPDHRAASSCRAQLACRLHFQTISRVSGSSGSAGRQQGAIAGMDR